MKKKIKKHSKKPMTQAAVRAERKIQKRKRRRKRIIILVVEIIILAALCAILYGMHKIDKLDINVLDEKKLEAYKDTGPYTNIALFGLDSREGELDGGVQSDCIMIASINNDTSEVTLTSVYRDTLLQHANGKYEKANMAYHDGGPEEAINLLNRNFDLDIKNYVSVNFNALVDVIDTLGGIEMEMTQEEAYYSNGYAFETAQVCGKEMKKIKEEAGTQLLDGVHAVGYARIRYTAGNDFKRTERQRVVLQKVAEKAKKEDLVTLNKLIDDVFPQVSTNLTIKDMMGFARHILDYKFVETSGFPYAVTTDETVKKHRGSYVVPIDLAANVIQLHERLFKDAEYMPSEKVQEISNEIIYLTDITSDTNAINTTFKGDIGYDGAESE